MEVRAEWSNIHILKFLVGRHSVPHVVGLQDISAHGAQDTVRDSDCRTREDIAAAFPVLTVGGQKFNVDLAIAVERHIIAAHHYIVRLVGFHLTASHFNKCNDGDTVLLDNLKGLIHLHVIASERERIRQIHTVARVHIHISGVSLAIFLIFIESEVDIEHSVKNSVAGGEGDLGYKVPSIGEHERVGMIACNHVYFTLLASGRCIGPDDGALAQAIK